MTETTTLAIGFGVVILYLVVLGIVIASYVLQSLSLYGISKKRDINNAWLAWVPIANCWIMGSITDDFDAQNGQKRKWRVTLLTLAVIVIASVIIFYAIFIAMAVAVAISSPYMAEPPMEEFIGFVIAIYIFCFVMAFAATLLQAINYICMFKIFEFIVPKKAVKYLILSTIVPLAYPICLLKCRDICPEKQVPVAPSMPAIESAPDEAEESVVLEEKSEGIDEGKDE